MEVIRHPTTGGTPVEFQFRASGSRFLVKNFTSGYITCGILDAEVTIPANTSQAIATRLIPRTSGFIGLEVGLYPFAPDDGMRQIRSSLGGGILMVATPSITTPAATAATTQEV